MQAEEDLCGILAGGMGRDRNGVNDGQYIYATEWSKVSHWTSAYTHPATEASYCSQMSCGRQG